MDITTAIQAGWKMLGEKETPKLNYHEDTKLLIAVGLPQKLKTIDAVLAGLQKAAQNNPDPGATSPGAESKPRNKRERRNNQDRTSSVGFAPGEC